MHRYRLEYESPCSSTDYTYSRLHPYSYIDNIYGGHWAPKDTFMERVKGFINENFFFRIEGVDSDDGSERLIDSDGTSDSEYRSSPGKDAQPAQEKGFGYEFPPEVIVEDQSRVSSPDLIKVEVSTQPTQLSCLSLSIYSAVIIAMVCIFLFIGRDYVKYILLSLEQADFWISLIVFCLLFTIVAFPMTWGYILLNISAGYLYGLVLGLVIVISCALTGLFVAHSVIRRFLRNFVLSKFTNKSFLSIMHVVDHSSIGFKVVVWARLTPIPFGLQNALFAVCGISTPRYLLASVLGMLPTQGMHAYIGSTLRSMEEVISSSSGSSTAYLVFGTQLLIAIGLLCYVIRRARTEFNKVVQTAQTSEQLLPPTEDLTHESNGTDNNSHVADKSYVMSHSRSASVPGTLGPGSYGQVQDRPRTGSFSPKPVSSRDD